MHDNDLARFSVGDEVSIYGGSAIYIVKGRKLNDDPQWPMWIYDCCLKDDGTESTKAFPEQVLTKPPSLPLGQCYPLIGPSTQS